jgi:FkbM family methyltransferase
MSFLKKTNKQNKWIKSSYSQSGEDLIIKYIFDNLHIPRPSYIDIGAHHPFYLSNTALFYQNGSTGINIEPDPMLFALFPEYRKRDININIGIGTDTGSADFYVISTPTLNTFSKDEAERYADEGDYRITEVLKIKTDSINNVLRDYNHGRFPDFLTIDAEGIDEIIIKSIDFTQDCPLVICIETLSFSGTGKSSKNTKITDFLLKNGYMIYADTFINTIFLRESAQF